MINIVKAIFAVMATVFIVISCVGLIETFFGNKFPIMASVFLGGIAAVISAIITVVWVVPIHLLLAKYNCRQFYWYILIAIIPMGYFMYLFASTGQYNLVTYLLQAAFCSAIGLSAAFVFWYVGVLKVQAKLTN